MTIAHLVWYLACFSSMPLQKGNIVIRARNQPLSSANLQLTLIYSSYPYHFFNMQLESRVQNQQILFNLVYNLKLILSTVCRNKYVRLFKLLNVFYHKVKTLAEGRIKQRQNGIICSLLASDHVFTDYLYHVTSSMPGKLQQTMQALVILELTD